MGNSTNVALFTPSTKTLHFGVIGGLPDDPPVISVEHLIATWAEAASRVATASRSPANAVRVREMNSFSPWLLK